ncbi:Gustatory receptor 66, partial [Hyalella azteca]
MKMTISVASADQRTLLLWQFRLLRMIETAPYKFFNAKYVTSHVYTGLSAALQISMTIITFASIFPIGKPASSDVYDVVRKYWGPIEKIVTTTIMWHFLASAKPMVIIINNLMRTKSLRMPVSVFVHLMIFMLIVDLGYSFRTRYEEPGDKIVNIFNFIIGHTNFLATSVGLFLHTVMKIVTFEIDNSIKTFCSIKFSNLNTIKNDSLFRAVKIFQSKKVDQTSKFSHDIKEPSTIIDTKPSPCHESEDIAMSSTAREFEISAIKNIDNIRKELMKLRHTVRRVHKAFSVAALEVLTYEQVELLFLILYGMYEENSTSSAWQAVLFTLPAAFTLCLVLNSQTEYRNVCEEGVHRVKKLKTEVGRMGPRHAHKVWQLRGIQAELERMPRFTIFGLFELGRHCLLS